MTNSKHIPKRRFKEFESDSKWEQNKLDEVAKFNKGKGYSKSDLQKKGSPIILYGRLYTKYETVISEVDTFTFIKENSVLSKGGEVLVPSSGESSEDISRASVVLNEGVILGGDLNIIKLQRKIEPVFLSLAISNGNQKKELSRRAQGKSVVHLNNDDLKQVSVLAPTINEQKKISNFFSVLDKLITLHQHKLDKLKNLKKSYLAELFPAEGERVPKRRFPGFEGEWEEKKLGEIVEVNSGKDYKHLDDGEIPVFGTGGYMLSVSEALSFRDGIGIGRKGTIDRPFILKAPFWTVDTLFYCIPKDEYDLQFVNSLFNLVKWKEYDESTGVPSLSKVSINNIQVFSPSLDEQKIIGRFLMQLEKQISLQQQKLDKLNDLKKAYLNELFV